MTKILFSNRKPGFETVYEVWYDRVYKYAYTLLQNPQDAEDVTADTFLAAYTQYDSFDPSRASVGTWLTRIAHNRAVDLQRSASRQRCTALPDQWDVSDSVDFTNGIAASDMVLRFYAILQPEERELLNLRYTMQLRDGEIAEMLGLPEKTVNKRYQRLLQKCRSILNGTE